MDKTVSRIVARGGKFRKFLRNFGMLLSVVFVEKIISLVEMD